LCPDIDSEHGSAADFAVDCDIAAHELHKIPADAKPQPRAFLGRSAGFRLRKGFKQAVQFIRGNAGTPIPDFKNQSVFRFRFSGRLFTLHKVLWLSRIKWFCQIINTSGLKVFGF
jgi:hypothetical protein